MDHFPGSEMRRDAKFSECDNALCNGVAHDDCILELTAAREKLEKTKASVRAKVEHCFHVVKCLFKYHKTRYRGLAKNNAQSFALFGFANLVLARRYHGSQHTQVAS